MDSGGPPGTPSRPSARIVHWEPFLAPRGPPAASPGYWRFGGLYWAPRIAGARGPCVFRHFRRGLCTGSQHSARELNRARDAPMQREGQEGHVMCLCIRLVVLGPCVTALRSCWGTIAFPRTPILYTVSQPRGRGLSLLCFCGTPLTNGPAGWATYQLAWPHKTGGT